MAVEDTLFGEVMVFLSNLGVYDVILPFLLIFTIVFAILEKTKILGMDEIEGKKYTKKSLNAIVAFVTGFLVVASSNLVRVINDVIANVVLLIIVMVMFLMLVGTMFGDKEVTLENYPGWTKFFMVLIFIGIIVIFLQAFGLLDTLISSGGGYFDSTWIAALVLIIFIIAFIWFVTKDKKESKSQSEK
ncbi:hypothetical protein ACFLZB_04815 [Nanoarchaeota archaeon]